MRDREAALVAEVRRADFGDDAPGLIYADWLEEQGDPERAEFIRLGTFRHDFDERLQARAAELRPIVAARLPDLAGWAWDPPERGFVRGAVVHGIEAFCRGIEAAMAALPLRSLAVRGPIGDDGARRLEGSEALRGLKVLDLASNGLGPDGLAAVLDSPQLEGLATLDLGHNPIGTAGAAVLAASPRLKAINRLMLERAEIDSAALAALAVSPHLGAVVDLRLGGNPFGGRGARALAEAVALRPTRLDLAGTPLGDEGLKALVGDAPALAPLECWSLARCQLTDRVGAAFAATRGLLALRHLDLRDNLLKGDAVAGLVEGWFAARLESLELGSNRIGDRGAEAIARAGPRLNRLTRLHLDRAWIGDRGAAALAFARGFAGLRHLDLSFNAVTGSGPRAFLVGGSLGDRVQVRWDAQTTPLHRPPAPLVSQEFPR